MIDIQKVVLVRLEGSWSTTYELDNNRQLKVVSLPTSGEAVDWVSIRSMQSLWPHIASVIHESAIQHSDSVYIMVITACSQHSHWVVVMYVFMVAAKEASNFLIADVVVQAQYRYSLIH